MILNQINKFGLVALLSLKISVACAAIFELTLSEQQIEKDQSVTLHFKLSDAKATVEPDFSALSQYFEIYTQGTSSSYSLLNGTLSQSTTWSLVLLPKNSGLIMIPAISVATNKGKLTTQSAQLQVTASNSANSGASPQANNPAAVPNNNSAKTRNSSKEIYLEGDFAAQELYVNQPFVYILKIYTRMAVANMSLSDMRSDDAIIERYGEPLQYNSYVNGLQTNVTEIKYIITPLHAGKITLNPASVRYEPLNSFFNRYSSGPGTIYSDEEVLKVLDIPGKIPPFSKLKVQDVWDSGNVEIHENDSITRTLKIIGEDGYVDALSVNVPTQTNDYNLYQDKTKETKNLNKDNHVHSEKIINYTIIPLKPGELLIPKTTIKWWNVKKKQIEELEIPEKKFTILPSATASAATAPEITEKAGVVNAQSVILDVKYKLLFSCSLILNALFVAFHLGKWLLKFKKSKPLLTLDEVNSIDNLKDYINYFVQDEWKIKGNLPLKDLWQELSKANFNYDQNLAKELTSKLNSNLYFKEELQVAKALDLWRKFSTTVVKKTPTKTSVQSAKLNPI